VHRGHLCPASARPTHCGRGAQHRPAHRATHLPMCHFAAHHTQKNTLIEFTVKNPSPGHIEGWGGRARRGLSKPIPAVQLDTYAASGAKFGPRWTSSSYPTNLTNLSTTPRPVGWQTNNKSVRTLTQNINFYVNLVLGRGVFAHSSLFCLITQSPNRTEANVDGDPRVACGPCEGDG
jgi:hypothetical protein